MIATKTTVSLRGQRQRDRIEKLRANIPPGVRVVPRDADMRRVLKHPTGGGFRKEGGATWPDDRFTKRRLMDGTVTREEQPKPAAAEPEQQEEQHNKPAQPTAAEPAEPAA
jgi:hypothetical protein